MAFSVKNASKEKNLPSSISYEGERLPFRYRGGSAVRDFEENILKLGSTADDDNDGGRLALCEALSEILIEWEMEGEDGKDVPLDPKVMASLPLPNGFFMKISQKIQTESQNGNPGSLKAS